MRKKKKNSKQFLHQIVIVFTFTVTILLIAFSSGITYQIEKSYRESENANNENILLQIKYNLDYMQNIIRDMAQGYLFDDTVISLMYLPKEIDVFELIQKMQRIDTFVKYSQYIYSISIYNNKLGTVYSTSPSLYTDEFGILDYMQSQEKVPRNRLVPMVSQITGERVFSFFTYESIDDAGMPDGAIAIHIKADWLLSNISVFNEVRGQKTDSIVILGQKGEIIAGELGNAEFLPVIQNEFGSMEDNGEQGKAPGTQYRMTQRRVGAGQYMISCIPLSQNDWMMVRIQNCSDFYDSVNQLKKTIFLSTAVFVFLSVLLTIRICQKLYAPVGELVKDIVKDFPAEAIKGEKNELRILMNIYQDSRERLSRFRDEAQNNQNIISTSYLRNVFADSKAVTAGEWDYIAKDSKLQASLDEELILCLFSINNYQRFCLDYSSGDQKLYKFAASNMIHELLEGHFRNMVLDLRRDQLLAVLNTENKENAEELAAEALVCFQQNMCKYFGELFTIIISGRVKNKYEISEAYNCLERDSEYRYVFGSGAVITAPMLQRRKNNEKSIFHIGKEMAKEIGEVIKLGNTDEVLKMLDGLYQDIVGQELAGIKPAIAELMNLIFSVSDELEASRNIPLLEDRKRAQQEIWQSETSEEAYEIIKRYLIELLGNMDLGLSEKYNTIMERIKKIVEESYSDSSLCLQSIADEIGLNAAYIGRIFKKGAGVSVNEYLNLTRMYKAAEWFEKSDLSVNEVMEKVGIENQSYFYKLFKKQFGTTPKNYAFTKRNS
ncbi:helix-turn-helix domain-containing protein [Eisenbergiella porci]|uniref:helix-turn-helix domain-containing protein n=1 Tax=Eisenbergiella porci TaxID=2652274 RepID=UPI002A808DCB|nr:helix-turn-helix transcriptional regulator [Eisenbergiella porci]